MFRESDLRSFKNLFRRILVRTNTNTKKKHKTNNSSSHIFSLFLQQKQRKQRTQQKKTINLLFSITTTTTTTTTSMVTKILIDAAVRKSSIHVRGSNIPTELIKSSQALLLFSATNSGSVATLPDLKYDYNALEPIISAETMTIHHTKHHNAYVTNLNIAMEKLSSAVSTGDVSSIIANQSAIKFNGGGHLNHTLFWDNLTPNKNTTCPHGPLGDAINSSFGNFDSMKNEFNTKTVAIQGSGWGWIGYNKATGRLEVATTANQDPLHATTGLVPLIGVDVWEHAYYVDYRNVRPDYVKNIWDILNWDVASERFVAAK